MASKYLLAAPVLMLVLLFGVRAQYTPWWKVGCPYPAFTPGFCPPSELRDFCFDDSWCQKAPNVKCCWNGCGTRCVEPAWPCPVKRGRCPLPPDYIDPDFCAVARFRPCFNDTSCEGDFKCCLNGCNIPVCSYPVGLPKLGLCPPLPIGITCSSIHYWCKSDVDCEADLKCCGNGCGTSCVRLKPISIAPKPGQCPPLVSPEGSVTLATDILTPTVGSARFCNTDHECPDKLKCCARGLQGGSVCTEPMA